MNDRLPWIERLAIITREIVRAGAPLVGICFGHQMIARALGGEAGRAAAGWGVGMGRVSVLSREPWMVPPAGSYLVLNSHADQVVRLAPGTRVVGASPHCPVAAMTVGARVLGIQGHPELVPEYVRRLVERRRGRSIPEDVADAALATLAGRPDRRLLSGWIRGFIG